MAHARAQAPSYRGKLTVPRRMCLTVFSVQLILQRKLQGDGSRWRSVGRFGIGRLADVMRAADSLARLVEPIAMRLVRDDRGQQPVAEWAAHKGDRKSTRLNSSHHSISYA